MTGLLKDETKSPREESPRARRTLRSSGYRVSDGPGAGVGVGALVGGGVAALPLLLDGAPLRRLSAR
jgi:hypothetical protein